MKRKNITNRHRGVHGVKWLPRCWSRCLQPVREGEEGGGPPVLYVGKKSEQSDISRPNMLSTACKMRKK